MHIVWPFYKVLGDTKPLMRCNVSSINFIYLFCPHRMTSKNVECAKLIRLVYEVVVSEEIL